MHYEGMKDVISNINLNIIGGFFKKIFSNDTLSTSSCENFLSSIVLKYRVISSCYAELYIVYFFLPVFILASYSEESFDTSLRLPFYVSKSVHLFPA